MTTGDRAAVITGSSGVIQKDPRQAVLMNARIEQPDRTLTADKGTLLFSPDNTVQHVVAEGNVHIQSRGPSIVDVYGPRGDLNMGAKNTVEQAIVSGGAKFDTQGTSVAHGSADTFIVDFEGQNEASKFHMVKNARMKQDPQPGKSGSSGQPMEIAADQLDFQLASGNLLKTADTVGKAADHDSAGAAGNASRRRAQAGSGDGRSELHHGGHGRQVPRDLRRQQSHPDAARLAELEDCLHHAG